MFLQHKAFKTPIKAVTVTIFILFYYLCTLFVNNYNFSYEDNFYTKTVFYYYHLSSIHTTASTCECPHEEFKYE